MQNPYDLIAAGAFILIASAVIAFRLKARRGYSESYKVTVLQEDCDVGGILKTYDSYETKIGLNPANGQLYLFERVWKRALLGGRYYADGKWRKLSGKEQKDIQNQLTAKDEKLKLVLED